jgi:hypothetical protein
VQERSLSSAAATSGAAGIESGQIQASLVALEAYRDFVFRRVQARRLRGERAALRFIEEVGFCTAFSAGLGLPCLREAIAGQREPEVPEHIQHDYAIGVVWRLKDALPARKLVYYGKVLNGRPSFIARELLPAFLRLRAAPGSYRRLYARGALSHCAKLVMDALVRRGAAPTRVLKLASGHSQPSRRPVFDRAMKELQEQFLALKVEEQYEPFSYVWDTLENRWPEAMREARKMPPGEAAYRIVRKYFEVAAFGSERTAARLLGLESARFESAARRLAHEHLLIRGVRLAGWPGAVSILAPNELRGQRVAVMQPK